MTKRLTILWSIIALCALGVIGGIAAQKTHLFLRVADIIVCTIDHGDDAPTAAPRSRCATNTDTPLYIIREQTREGVVEDTVIAIP